MRKVKSRKRSNPVDIPSNRLIAVDYIAITAKNISSQVHRTVNKLSMADLSAAVKLIDSLQNDLNILGFRLPEYLKEEPKKKWANDPERWL